jgi:hypothetical protein
VIKATKKSIGTSEIGRRQLKKTTNRSAFLAKKARFLVKKGAKMAVCSY